MPVVEVAVVGPVVLGVPVVADVALAAVALADSGAWVASERCVVLWVVAA